MVRRAVIGLAVLGVAVPLLSSFLRRRRRVECPRHPWEPIVLVDDLTTGKPFSPQDKQRMLDWYRGVMADKATSKPCIPVECPPMEEVTIASWPEMIAGWLADVASAEAKAIETACEQALQTGYMGVRTTRSLDPDGAGGWVWVVEAQATASVPYGHIQGDWGPPSPMGIVGFQP